MTPPVSPEHTAPLRRAMALLDTPARLDVLEGRRAHDPARQRYGDIDARLGEALGLD
jgi:hypothetical protein